MTYRVPTQLSLPTFCPVAVAPVKMARAGSMERGAVYTKGNVVEFILDLAGYTPDLPLYQFRLLEPAFGQGDFLLAVVQRLLTSYTRNHPHSNMDFQNLANSIRAVEIHPGSMEKTRVRLLSLMEKMGLAAEVSEQLLDTWMIAGDFLLTQFSHKFTHAVGNPPYVRTEHIPDALMVEYRARYVTIYDRADIYIPFIEQSLKNLDFGGKLGFICADRWMKNRYGGPLRAMVADGFHLAYYVDMVGTPAFHSEVTAYPAITIITRENSGPTRVVSRPAMDSVTLSRLAQAIKTETLTEDGEILEIANVVNGHEPWILHHSAQLALVRRLERDFPTLEDVGCMVGIGVATGADRVFIGDFDALNVEPSRKLPLVKTGDIKSGEIVWKGLGVINPFHDKGTLVDLNEYPKLSRYLFDHETIIRRRHCAKKNPVNWYRTIDRINPKWLSRPKLLIPDIKGEAHVVYDDGQFYPHHNLYFITSDQWDLQALRVVLRSGIAKMFVSTYSTQMRGGYLRFQAQYLRRIRLPSWQSIPLSIQQKLEVAAESNHVEMCHLATCDLYGLSQDEREVVGGNEKKPKP